MLNKLYKILFINLFLITLQTHAAPPPLPPVLPNSDSNAEVSSNSDSSIFDKVKSFFGASSKKTPQSQIKQDEQDESKLASHEPDKNEASEPFIDTGNTKLPTASNETNVNLASHSNNEVTNTGSSKQANEEEASEPFMDTGNTKLPTATNNDLPDNETAQNNSTNLASANIMQPVTTNVPQPLVTMPPLKPGTPVVPPHPNLIIPEPVKLPPTHIPTPLNPQASTAEEQSNIAPAAAPITDVQQPVVNIPTIPDNATAPATPATPTVAEPIPAIPDNTSVPATVPTQTTVPTTPNSPPANNMPPMPVPVINSPTAPNTTPNNLPTTQPTTTPTPVAPAIPTVPTTTDSSGEMNNQHQTFTANADSSKKQGWDTPLKPVEVITAKQTQSSNNANLPANQTKLQNTDFSKIVVKKQDNVIKSTVTESATKFAKDESQMLLLPNDDIVLGRLTEQANLEQMDIYSYIKLFQKKEEWVANASRRQAVESLIRYDNNINKKKDIYANLSYCSAVDNAFKAIDRDNLSKLRALLDVYPILQEKNRQGDTLLTAATYKDNYYLAKYLVIRGIKISTLNSECQYPLDIALAQGSNNIACMLIKARL